MNSYVELVLKYPMYSAMLQFALLGTLGDVVAKCLQQKKMRDV